MSDYQTAERLIAEGKEMLNKTFIGKTINDFDISKLGSTHYRYSMFTGYIDWKNKVQSELNSNQHAYVYSAIINSIGDLHRRYNVIQQTVQIAETVVDETVNLKARIAELEASEKNLINAVKEANKQTKDAIECVKQQQSRIDGLTTSLRQLRLNSLVTKVTNVVTQKVGF